MLQVMLEQMQGLMHLELSGCNDFTEAGLWSSLNARLTSLSVSDCINVADDAIAAISQLLPNLSELSLQAYHVTDTAMAYFTAKQVGFHNKRTQLITFILSTFTQLNSHCGSQVWYTISFLILIINEHNHNYSYFNNWSVTMFTHSYNLTEKMIKSTVPLSSTECLVLVTKFWDRSKKLGLKSTSIFIINMYFWNAFQS